MAEAFKVSIKEENEHLKRARTCLICNVNEVRIVYFKCGHLVSCEHCPIPDTCVVATCRKPVRGHVKAFLN